MKARRAEPLTRDRVLEAALALLDRDGLDALSMRRLGEALGVEAMSLYNHVPNKAALLDGLHERILALVEPPPRTNDWQLYARHQARALHQTLCAHPGAITLFATRPARTPASLARFEQYLAMLVAAGFTPDHAVHVVQIVMAFVVGHAMWTVSTTEPDDRDDASAELELGLDAFLRGLQHDRGRRAR
jgi:AcrR family transcriptional regulator